nr:methyltransferase domain-containing protein [Micromonospora sp. DSM 115978]
MRAVPGRVLRAVEVLGVRGGDRVLEIGCGRGVAASIVCAGLVGGRVLGIDRSAKAIEAARRRNPDPRSGRARVPGRRFDDFNVNRRLGALFFGPAPLTPISGLRHGRGRSSR